MNPFDLPGPEFLAFYVVLTAIVLVLLYVIFQYAEDGQPPTLPLRDPYKIAWLRGGNREAARMAVLSLTDRGLVELVGSKLSLKAGRRVGVRHPLEQAIVRRCEAGPLNVGSIAKDRAVETVCDQYRNELDALHLTADRSARAYRWRLYAVGATVLAGVALSKIVIALDRGRTNIGFLVILAILGPLVALILVRRRRTRLGDRVLADLRQLFERLRSRAPTFRRGQMTSDVMLLAAVFGFSALPSLYSDLQRAYASTGGNGGGGSSDGGSGCGGGGGGCGGCGSS
jgi:uncharacterized protein (TIGR04222 family)